MDFQSVIYNPQFLQISIVVIVVVFGLISYVLHNKGKMITIVQGLMLQAEKAADQFVLTNGPTTFNFVVSQAYPLLPAIFRVFLTFEAFKKYAQKLYDLGVFYFNKGIAQSPPNVLTTQVSVPEQAVSPSADASTNTPAVDTTAQPAPQVQPVQPDQQAQAPVQQPA
ncbi:hypothetical protein [Desulfosporosinus acididurans]|nr:hypothetical protein [Desulfosporosinus acididurans]